MRLTEAVVREALEDPSRVPGRLGFEYGIPRGGTSSENVAAHGGARMQLMEQLNDAYMQCNWVSACVDTIARTVTAGGLLIVPDDDTPEGKQPVEPPGVVALRTLMCFTNPREDMIQVLRGTIADLLIFGDAYLEVSAVGGQPVAVYSLDAATMSVLCDEHGKVLGYEQYIDQTRRVPFKEDQVIHLSLDSPRGGMYGKSPAEKALLSITAWLFAAACVKETMRRGDPPRIHADMPKGTSDQAQQKWADSYMVRNLGVKNIGTPIQTSGGGLITELSASKVQDMNLTMDKRRDEILSTFGCPPSKVGVIESGNLGGGTGEAQDKTWRVNTIIPIANLLLEKLNYALVQKGFAIEGWHLEFEEIDFRDSKIVEEVRDMRLRNGSFTLNRYRGEIGEPDVEGGDNPIFVLSRNVLTWKNMEHYTDAEIAQMDAAAKAAAEPKQAPVAAVMAPADAKNQPDTQGKPPKEGRDAAAEMESLRKAYQHRRKATLKALPNPTEDTAA